MSDEILGIRIHVKGIVQGVGFRPFVYGLAQELDLAGWVQNTSAGVEIELDGATSELNRFLEALNTQAPPLSKIDSITSENTPLNGFSVFSIIESQVVEGAFQPVSPDVSLCPDCSREMFDPEDRRYRYPFINCTNCGPRFTIINDIPYDRPYTTMAPFEMCEHCAREYYDPLDRRFHAQPVACPVCGPHVWLEIDGEILYEKGDAIIQARKLLHEKKILAVKGLGGFHLACDATDPVVVGELRRRKLRVDKAFAVMAANIEAVETHCKVSGSERQLLLSRERPIVILDRAQGAGVVREIAPGQNTIGMMLPYTPLHELLLQPDGERRDVLVMTSGNLSEEPIATENVEARTRLDQIADAFLMHDRNIRTRCDDSVVRVFEDEIYPLRRSRGYAPYPLQLPWMGSPVLAVGAELKNTFCISRDDYAFLSHHIGDMENYETLQSFEDGISHFERLFRITPEAIAYDLHPDYLATSHAIDRAAKGGIPAIGVQHHHAHIASCMAEHKLPSESEVIGIAFDGTGYGDDGAIWGGEVLVSGYADYERAYHLCYVPLPGGDKAIREPWRVALSWMKKAGLEIEELPGLIGSIDPGALDVVLQQIELGINCPLTSSMGRLFDAVASIVGIRSEVNYEAQAAIELEALVEGSETGSYKIEIHEGVIDPSPLIRSVVSDLSAGMVQSLISAKFHNSMANMVVDVCDQIRETRGLEQVVLSGGVWQNMVFLHKVVPQLRERGYFVLVHREAPTNDGGIALGQLAVAQHRLGLSS
jgi:hydrogenase maturation protein HypF